MPERGEVIAVPNQRQGQNQQNQLQNQQQQQQNQDPAGQLQHVTHKLVKFYARILRKTRRRCRGTFTSFK